MDARSETAQRVSLNMENRMTSIVQQILDKQKYGSYDQDLRELTILEWYRNHSYEMPESYEFNCERIDLLRKRVRRHIRVQRMTRRSRCK